MYISSSMYMVTIVISCNHVHTNCTSHGVYSDQHRRSDNSSAAVNKWKVGFLKTEKWSKESGPTPGFELQTTQVP